MTEGIKQQRSLQARIDQIKHELVALGELRPGHLSQQYNVCGTPGCRCKATPPQKHGPYYQLSFTWQGESHTQFVRQQDLAMVQEQVENYQRLRELVDTWIGLSMELARLRVEEQRTRKAPPKSRGGSRKPQQSRA
jgi:hypothetical protein